MLVLRVFLFRLLACALPLIIAGLSVTLPARAGTVAQYTPYAGYWHGQVCAGCSLSATLELSTSDGWQTADIAYTATGLFPGPATDLLSSVSFQRMLTRGTQDFDFSAQPTPRAFNHRIDLLNSSGQAVSTSFTGNYSGKSERPAWEVLAGGLYISQFYSGYEFSTDAYITFDDRAITSYMFDLWGGEPVLPVLSTASFARSFAQPPQVPLPPAITGLLAGLAALGGVAQARRRKASARTAPNQ